MTNSQNAQFTQFAGQLIASGINTNMPLIALEGQVNATVLANLAKIHGLIPKITDVFVHETKIFQSPIEKFVTKFDSRYGAGMEQIAFAEGAYNQKYDGTCVPIGNPDVASQLNIVNFAYNVEVSVKDREVDRGVLNEAQAGAYIAQKLKTPLKTIGSLKHRAWIQLLSDVIDGTRSISSKDAGNTVQFKSGASSVTDNPTITGYAGQVAKRNEVMPMVQVGDKYEINSPIDALNILNDLKAKCADFKFETTAYNKLGIETFVTGVPLLIAEVKVLDAFDTVFAEFNAKGNANGNYGYAGFPTVSAREYIRQFAELVEIDTFASLPTDPNGAEVTYAGYNLHFVLIDRDALIENIKWADSEGQRCSLDRRMGYSFQGESILSIWRGVDSYAQVFKAGGVVTLSGGTAVYGSSSTAIVSGTTMVAPGETITLTPTSGTITGVTVNGVSMGAVDTITMPQEDATIVITSSA